ncbi:hypothetical protein CC78DRAFT_580335 [Lojkania enalia]|uniref:HMG box domain-containing protein n=1 Tax=Lojkania enalia TaxID=147567 RepID=A0A9P4KDN0_9PLEO|nr:hypothetical protein CC78DRAFT_580335 [Didymosphaeria enalia]
MESETLVPCHPPTPPNINTEIQAGLHHISRFNAGDNYPFEEPQRHNSAYGSPGPQSLPVSHAEDYDSLNVGLGIQYEGYGPGPTYYQREGQSNEVPNNAGMYSGSPPTPASATEHDNSSRRTRSGCTIAQPSSPVNDRPKPKSTPKKKAKAGKSEKPRTPKLTAPLSVLTNDLTSIPVRNMEEWVNRSAEVRRQEVEKRNGYVTRPMNSFMLYRSAYAERTKHWCLQNNHQIVSSVSGESWPMEPAEIRELYNELAKIERINHQNAHPTYKFSPSKTTTASSKKRKGDHSDEDDISDLDDVEWAPGQGRSRAISSKRPERSIGYLTNYAHPQFFERTYGQNINSMNKSAWDMAYEGRPMSMPMVPNEVYSQQYFQAIQPNMTMQEVVMEDPRMQRMDTPVSSMQFSPGHVLLGLPGGNATDMMQHLHSPAGTPLGDDSQVDPMLLDFDGEHQHDINPAMLRHPEFRNGHLAMMERELEQDSLANLLPPHNDYHAETWQPDPSITQLEQGSEFDKWMDDHAG